jgi:hypothetical protein
VTKECKTGKEKKGEKGRKLDAFLEEELPK